MDQTVYQVPCVYPLRGRRSEPLRVQVPGSKSITNRALLLATLAQGTSTLRGVLFSDDSRHFLKCVQDLGFETAVDEEAKTVSITGLGGRIPRREASLYVGSAGTAARFLAAALGTAEGVYHMDASDQMRRRPMAPLLDSLRELGCEVSFEGQEGFFPFTLTGHGFGRDHITVDIGRSSQFLSALLIASCLSPRDMTVQVEGTHGMAYIEITRRMMEQFGVTVRQDPSGAYRIPAGQSYRALDYSVEPDVSGACYFYALSPLLGIPVQVTHVTSDSMQGDLAFLSLLERMGCRLTHQPEGITVLPPREGVYWGIEADMSACSDQAITLAVLGVYASCPTTITGIGHIRFQECNRLEAVVTQLGRLGIRCESTPDSITVHPGRPRPGKVDTYEDHRMAMGFSLLGLRTPGIVIDNPGCCKKTFENYFECLDACVGQLQS